MTETTTAATKAKTTKHAASSFDMGYFEFAGSTSPVPPQTSQRRRPVPLHSLQFPVLIPTMDFLPVP